MGRFPQQQVRAGAPVREQGSAKAKEQEQGFAKALHRWPVGEAAAAAAVADRQVPLR